MRKYLEAQTVKRVILKVGLGNMIHQNPEKLHESDGNLNFLIKVIVYCKLRIRFTVTIKEAIENKGPVVHF